MEYNKFYQKIDRKIYVPIYGPIKLPNYHSPLAEQEINLKKRASKTNSSLRSSIGPKKKFITYGEVAPRKFVYKVSCLFTKYLLTCGFVTIDGTEKLC